MAVPYEFDINCRSDDSFWMELLEIQETLEISLDGISQK